MAPAHTPTLSGSWRASNWTLSPMITHISHGLANFLGGLPLSIFPRRESLCLKLFLTSAARSLCSLQSRRTAAVSLDAASSRVSTPRRWYDNTPKTPYIMHRRSPCPKPAHPSLPRRFLPPLATSRHRNYDGGRAPRGAWDLKFGSLASAGELFEVFESST